MSVSPRTSTGRITTDERVLKFAPLLRFAPAETHYPIDPATFVAHARLRRFGWSERVADAIWHPGWATWDTAAATSAPAWDPQRPGIAEACRVIQIEARAGYGGENRRPWDRRNMWQGRRAGYALELVDPHAGELQGVAGAAPFLLYDLYSADTAAGPREIVSYWLFYARGSAPAEHEGDWQHVSVLLPAGDETPRVLLGRPGGVASHALADFELAEATHPVVYVSPGSHVGFRSAAEAGAGSAADYAVALRTWRLEGRRVPVLDWSCFDGAWGAVGADADATGPLGPLFRRLYAAGAEPEPAAPPP